MRLWRISNHADLQGIGGLRASGRWHTRGRPVVYLAESPPGALIEVLVHVEVRRVEDLPDRYTLLTVAAPEPVATETCPPLVEKWMGDLTLSRAIGDAWLAAGRTALLRVPSAIMPGVWNQLLNPLHPDAGHLQIETMARLPFDPRLFKVIEPLP